MFLSMIYNLSHNKIIGQAIATCCSFYAIWFKIRSGNNLQNCGIKCAGSRDIIMALENYFDFVI